MIAKIRKPGDFFREIVGRPVEAFLCLAELYAAIEEKRGHKLGYSGSAGAIPAVRMGSSAEIDRRVEEAHRVDERKWTKIGLGK